ncbi:MAG: hypothetical protein M1838_001044 [Thelocarpon superellum]|nr:MAG: hypothetical protein M1838_001044 [Thelocarpon superellum]
MGRPKRSFLATAEETATPPVQLSDGQQIARVVKATGSHNYSVALPSGDIALVELPSRFRSTIWIKRDGFVVVDLTALPKREKKLTGEIVNVVRNEKEWRRESYWPLEFASKSPHLDTDDEQASVVGKLPPSQDSDNEP